MATRKKRAAKKKVTKRSAATTAPEAPRLASTTEDIDNGVLTCVFTDNQQCQFIVKGPSNNLSPEVKTRAMLHGIVDRLKKSRDPKDLVTKMLSGEWPRGRAAAGTGRISRPVIAYARVLRNVDASYAAHSEEEVIRLVAAQWRAMPKEQRDIVLDDWRVKLEVKKLTLEAQGGEADLTSLLTPPAAAAPQPPAPAPAQPEPPPITAPVAPAPQPQPVADPMAFDPAAFSGSPFGPALPGDGSVQ